MLNKAYASYTIVDVIDGLRWLGSLDEEPGSARQGDAYYNTVTKQSYLYDGQTWHTFAYDGLDAPPIYDIIGVPEVIVFPADENGKFGTEEENKITLSLTPTFRKNNENLSLQNPSLITDIPENAKVGYYGIIAFSDSNILSLDNNGDLVMSDSGADGGTITLLLKEKTEDTIIELHKEVYAVIKNKQGITGGAGDSAEDFNVTASSYFFILNNEEKPQETIVLTAHLINLEESLKDNVAWFKVTEEAKTPYPSQENQVKGLTCTISESGTYTAEIVDNDNNSWEDSVIIGTIPSPESIGLVLNNPTMTFNSLDDDTSENCSVIAQIGTTSIHYSSTGPTETSTGWCYTITHSNDNKKMTVNGSGVITVYKPENNVNDYVSFTIKVYLGKECKLEQPMQIRRLVINQDFDLWASTYAFIKQKDGTYKSSIKLEAILTALSGTVKWYQTVNGKETPIPQNDNKTTYIATEPGFYTAKLDGTQWADSVELGVVEEGKDTIGIWLKNPTMTFNASGASKGDEGDKGAHETTEAIVLIGENDADYTSITPTESNNSDSGWQYTITTTDINGINIGTNGVITVYQLNETSNFTRSVTITIYYNGKEKTSKVFAIQCSVINDGINAYTIKTTGNNVFISQTKLDSIDSSETVIATMTIAASLGTESKNVTLTGIANSTVDLENSTMMGKINGVYYKVTTFTAKPLQITFGYNKESEETTIPIKFTIDGIPFEEQFSFSIIPPGVAKWVNLTSTTTQVQPSLNSEGQTIYSPSDNTFTIETQGLTGSYKVYLVYSDQIINITALFRNNSYTQTHEGAYFPYTVEVEFTEDDTGTVYKDAVTVICPKQIIKTELHQETIEYYKYTNSSFIPPDLSQHDDGKENINQPGYPLNGKSKTLAKAEEEKNETANIIWLWKTTQTKQWHSYVYSDNTEAELSTNATYSLWSEWELACDNADNVRAFNTLTNNGDFEGHYYGVYVWINEKDGIAFFDSQTSNEWVKYLIRPKDSDLAKDTLFVKKINNNKWDRADSGGIEVTRDPNNPEIKTLRDYIDYYVNASMIKTGQLLVGTDSNPLFMAGFDNNNVKISGFAVDENSLQCEVQCVKIYKVANADNLNNFYYCYKPPQNSGETLLKESTVVLLSRDISAYRLYVAEDSDGNIISTNQTATDTSQLVRDRFSQNSTTVLNNYKLEHHIYIGTDCLFMGNSKQDPNFFINYDGNVVIKQGSITLGGTSGNPTFRVDQNGNLWAKNAQIDGIINASSGSIGGWQIGDLYNSPEGTDGRIKLASGIYKGKTYTDGTFRSSGVAVATREVESVVFWAGCNKESPWVKPINDNDPTTTAFYVTDMGNVKLGSGTLGSNNTLFLSTQDMAGVNGFFDGTTIKNWRLTVGKNFGVTADGGLYSKKGYIGGFQVIDNGLSYSLKGIQMLSLTQNGLQVGNFSTYYDSNSQETRWETNGPLVIAGKKENQIITSITLMDTGSDLTGKTCNFTLYAVVQNKYNIYQYKYESYYSLELKAPDDAYYPITRTFTIKCTADGETSEIYKTLTSGQFVEVEYGCNITALIVFLDDKELIKLTEIPQADNGLNSYPSSKTDQEIIKVTQKAATNNILIKGNLCPNGQNTTFNLGTSTYKWNNIYAAHSTGIGDSDARIKNSISLLDEKYATMFDLLKPVSYKFNENTSNRTHIGLIAQEVKEAITQSGLTTQDFAGYCEWPTEDGDYGCGLRYGEFVSLCINEIQKLKKRIEVLEQNKI